MRHDVGLTLVSLGCAVAALACLGAAVVGRDVFVRLHFVTPVTSLAGPLVAAGLCVESGQPWAISEILVITLLLGIAGAVLESATARTAGQNHHLVGEEQPQ